MDAGRGGTHLPAGRIPKPQELTVEGPPRLTAVARRPVVREVHLQHTRKDSVRPSGPGS